MSQLSPDTVKKTAAKEKEQEQIKEPSMYRVLLHNDDYTPMNFVVEILMFVFHKSYEEAHRIMLSIHRKGIGVCGVYTFEIAETKVNTVEALSREKGFPLKCTLEDDSL